MVIEVLKYIFIVLGIVVVGAFIIYALATLMLSIVDPHAKDKNRVVNDQKEFDNSYNKQVYYEQPKLLAENTTYNNVEEENAKQEDIKDVDLEKAKEEEMALSKGTSTLTLAEEEDAYFLQKQKQVEERINAKKAKEQEKVVEDEINLDDFFIDDDIEEKVEDNQAQEDEEDDDIDALINKILAESEEEDNEDLVNEEKEEENNESTDEEDVVLTQQTVVSEEKQENDMSEEQDIRIKELEEQLALLKEEYENKLKQAEIDKEQETNAEIESLKKALEEKDKVANAEIEALKNALEQNEAKNSAGSLSLEEYEERLKILNERLAVNEKEFRVVKKEYLPLAKIRKSYEKDKTKLRRKEALVAKQKVVLYGVNNYVDIDEEKAKKLSEDLDLLDGLRLSVQHCEEILKQNEERLPILENSYNILLNANETLKADIAECNEKIAELKASQE